MDSSLIAKTITGKANRFYSVELDTVGFNKSVMRTALLATCSSGRYAWFFIKICYP